MAVKSLKPLTAREMHYLVLGSMPGAISLKASQYYANPRNAFWPIMHQLFGVDPKLSYAKRCAELQAKKVGLWDVIASCKRKGSLDSAIETGSVTPNLLYPWLSSHPLKAIGLNGATATKLFFRHSSSELANYLVAHKVRVLSLPSTSPANATMKLAEKLARWRALIE